MASNDPEAEDNDRPYSSSAPPDEGGEGEGADDFNARRHRIERMLRETLRRGLEKGIETSLETFTRSEKAIRGVVGSELPREIVTYVFSQVDETKNALTRVVAREVRDFLNATDLAEELRRALTSLSFEVRTEIRFVPNDAGGVRPSVRTKGATGRRRDSEPPPEDDEG